MITAIVKKLKRKYFPTLTDKNAKVWFADEGDLKHRLNYPQLNENSVVFDLGGYKGQFASDIFSRYFCNVYVFEPVKKFYDLIAERFSTNNKIQVFHCALGNKNSKETIFLSADATSTHRHIGAPETIIFKDFAEFLEEHGIHKIDLLKINIEGGEYEVLEYLIAKDLARNIKNIQVQFHEFIPNALQRMRCIQAGLAKTHKLTYQYEFIWENWQLKQS